MQKIIHIASRTSQLAQIMTKSVVHRLNRLQPDSIFEILNVKTSNEQIEKNPFGIKGVFTNALDEAVRRDDAICAVHSTKDLPSLLNEDMTVAAFLERGNPRDALISKHNLKLNQLPKNAIIGTASLRRSMLVKHLRPDIQIKSLRGNIDTRLNKKDQYDAIILAASGLERFDNTECITEILEPTVFVPAAGQGAIAITCKKDDSKTLAMLAKLDDLNTRKCVEIERTICEQLNLSCHSPIGIYANIKENRIHLNIHLILNQKEYSGVYSSTVAEIPNLILNALEDIKEHTS